MVLRQRKCTTKVGEVYHKFRRGVPLIIEKIRSQPATHNKNIKRKCPTNFGEVSYLRFRKALIWNVDAKELFQQARANTQPVNTPILQSMDEMMLSIFNEEGHSTNLLDESVDFGLRSHDMLYALTNMEKQYGASMITQPEVLNKLDQLFPEGFYVLPSSVHEVLIVPDNGEVEPRMLGEMVREVNRAEVEREEVLSDRVYSYDKEKHQIRQEPDSIQKAKEMER